MKPLSFKDTCGKRIDGPITANIINFVSEKLGINPSLILTKSQLDEAMKHLFSVTPPGEREALTKTLSELNEQALKAYMADLNPFAAQAVESMFNDARAGRLPLKDRVDHIAKVAQQSHWQTFQSTKKLPDTCGKMLLPEQAQTVQVVCEVLDIPATSLQTQSQLEFAMYLLKLACRDEEHEAEVRQKLRDASLPALEYVKSQVSGLGLEALNALTDVAKGNRKMDTEQVQRLAASVKRSLLQDLKRKFPDLEAQIAESGDENAKKLLASFQ